MVTLALAGATAAAAQAGIGVTGDGCNVTDVTVTKLPSETLFVYQVDCPGTPLGWFGGNATAKYREIGNWNQQTRTAHENLYSFDRGQGITSAWTCDEDPWIGALILPDHTGWPDGHTCQLQSQSGGKRPDYRHEPTWPVRRRMCFNEPWGESLGGCWANDQLTATGPSAAILDAWLRP
jgi:hypothetical protein